ncbi:MAG: ABC transporter ATP-binding protein [Deltaproteobacteria bacterium]|nr:ABC transporter ATP-binding protein [Deltaproteobacteria bacterium]
MTDPGWLVEVKNLGKSFGKKRVLSELSFTVGSGLIAGIVGANGAGKSTLLKIMVGLLPPGQGSARVNGIFGYCPQEAGLFEDLTVQEHFRYFAAAYGLSTTAWQSSAGELCARYRLGEYLEHKVSQLSGGNRQKLNLLLSLMHKPKLLFLDEPYSGFDWETYLVFWEHAREMRDGGGTIIVVTHLIHDRKDLDVLYQLEGGRFTC